MDVVRKHGKRNKYIRRGIAAFGTVAAAMALTGALARLEPAAPSVPRQSVVIDEVKRGQMICDVRAHGTLVPVEITWITAESNGRIVALPIKPGTPVTPETVILQMSNPQLNKELEDARWLHISEVATLRAREAELQNQLLELQSLEAQMRAEYRDAELQLNVDEQLLKDELISGQKHKLSQGSREQRKERLAVAEEKVANFRESIEPQLDVQRAKVAQAEALLKLKQRQVDNLTIRAGIKGILQQLGASSDLASTSSRGRPLAVGQWVLEGAPLAMVTDPAHLQAELQVPEVQARDVLFGQKVEVNARVATILGKVVRIDPAVNQGTVTVDVELDGELPTGARPDLSVDGRIIITHLEDVLYTGRMLSGGIGSSVGIFKLSPDGQYAQRTKVTLGRNSVQYMEVVEGLAVGDKIISSDMTTWDDHDRIRLQ